MARKKKYVYKDPIRYKLLEQCENIYKDKFSETLGAALAEIINKVKSAGRTNKNSTTYL